ncbi:hypothetical protein [Halobacillus amylolyticus]|uniref:CopG family transcriptional regulator n=1 Tax=Halobacillus amylolyticus TaxID=2932259 RepID=A0ABY4HIC7_9BACI|nr:hypothetical protein [Halobacillus amylolyticus]UOR14158.1 hypothetical protein MUO15_20940 [Halobacillus amylolyticus]
MSKKDKYSSLLNKKNTSAIKNEKHVNEAHNTLFHQDDPKKGKSNNNQKKKKFEDKYKRATFYIENDIIKLLDKQAGKEKGEKTRLVNEALRQYLS